MTDGTDGIRVVVPGAEAVSLSTPGSQGVRMRNGPQVIGHYPALTGKPSIEGHVLEGDSTIQEIGVGTLSVQEIEKILYRID